MLCPAPLKLPAAAGGSLLEHLSAVPAACSPHTLSTNLCLVNLDPCRSFSGTLFPVEKDYLYSEHCLCLSTALGRRRNVFQIGFFFSLSPFSFDLYIDDQGGLYIVLGKIAMTFLRNQSCISVLYGSEFPYMM